MIKIVDLDKLANREFHDSIAEKKSNRGRKRQNECVTVSKYQANSNGKVNQQRLAVKYLLSLNPDKWPLLRKVTFFNEILNENTELFDLTIQNDTVEQPLFQKTNDSLF